MASGDRLYSFEITAGGTLLPGQHKKRSDFGDCNIECYSRASLFLMLTSQDNCGFLVLEEVIPCEQRKMMTLMRIGGMEGDIQVILSLNVFIPFLSHFSCDA